VICIIATTVSVPWCASSRRSSTAVNWSSYHRLFSY